MVPAPKEDVAAMSDSVSADCGKVLIVLAMVGVLCSSAPGIIISTGQPLSDTEVAAGFTYWDNIGWRGTLTGSNSDGSCVYLGDSWVLTANHVGSGNVIFDGVTYAEIAGTSQQISNADARVFRIANPSASLQAVTIFDGQLSSGTAVKMFGTGLDQEPDKTYWRVTPSGPDFIWSEVPTKNQADASGYYWANSPATRIKRWGTNEIDDVFTSSGRYYFETAFDEGDTVYEANAADKDSGGAVFTNNGGSWELIGISIALSYWADQPDAAVDWVDWSTSSGNRTRMVDLTQYRDEILAATPEPIPLPGDLNGDDLVAGADLDIILTSWGMFVDPSDPADPSGDGLVAGADLDIVLTYWGTGTPPPAGESQIPEPATAAMIPEPATVAILALGGLVGLKRRK